MISRKITITIAEMYHLMFRGTRYDRMGSYPVEVYNLKTTFLYDYLYERNYEAWFINTAKALYSPDERALKEFIMRLHTGETVAASTPNWTWEKRAQLGQRLLKDLAEDALVSSQKEKFWMSLNMDRLTSELELDGYIFKEGKLYFSEAAVLDTEGEVGILEKLIQELGLENQEVITHTLKLSEEHFISGKWEDSISNSRKFLESVLQEIASKHHQKTTSQPINPDTYSRPVEIRKYLETAGLIASKEKEAIASVYQLLSETGSHPYVAEKDQARLMRYLALTFSQFALLRFQGFLQSTKG